MWKGYLALSSELGFTAFKLSLLKCRNSRDLRADHKVLLFVERREGNGGFRAYILLSARFGAIPNPLNSPLNCHYLIFKLFPSLSSILQSSFIPSFIDLCSTWSEKITLVIEELGSNDPCIHYISSQSLKQLSNRRTFKNLSINVFFRDWIASEFS